MPARLAVGRVAMPEEFVVAVPTEMPFSENEIVLPLTDPLAERVACRLTVPPKAPVAFGTARVEALTTARPIAALSESL